MTRLLSSSSDSMEEELETSVLNSSRRASTASDLGQGGAGDEGEDHIRVICRVRPPNAREGRSALGLRTCVSVDEDGKTVRLKAGQGPKLFTFDHSVGPEGGQETLFQLAGKPATRACMQGYNGTVFCYGQTGSGKTYTMFGPNVNDAAGPTAADGAPDEQRGLVPRVLEYLFAHVAREGRRNGGSVRYLCRCSFYEIFNERVFDLLDAGCALGGLQTREDMKKGVYVEGLTEEAVDSPHQAYQVLTRGYRNRHVGETAMNRESSRSHAVFTVVLESREADAAGGVTRSRCAAFNLVDLAGSERQSATKATGERLKEASSINKSLSALGNVINALVSGKTRYVPYRDSRLTFLLRDSLGGNAKTFLVACTSPNDENFAETLSTLKFAQRAKMIKNKAVVNENTTGTVDALQRQLKQLRQELLAARAVISVNGGSVPRALLVPSSEDGEVGTTGSTFKSHAELRKTEALLRDALDRCLRLEEARGVAEGMAGNVQETVTRLEQALLSEKMARKMKESQIARLQKKAPAGEGSTTEAELRAEIEALRKEAEQVPLEVVKWRAAAENAQAQLDALVDEKGLGMWVEAREQTFATRLEEQLRAALADKAALEEQLANGGGAEGGLAAGVGDKRGRRLSDGGMTRLREAEGKAQLLEEELATAKRAAEEAGAQLAEARAAAAQAVSMQSQLQVKLTLAERRVEALEGENRVLKADRDFQMKILEERQQDQAAQAQQAQSAKQDVEAQLAAACKDNAVLLQRLKETAGEADEMAARRAAGEARAQALEEEVATLKPQLAAAEAAVEEGKAALAAAEAAAAAKEEALTEQLATLQASATAAAAAHAAEANHLRTAADEAAQRAQALGQEKEAAEMALAAAGEEQDTLREEMEFLRGRMADAEEALKEARAEMEGVDKERAKAEGALAEALQKVAELEDQLDKAGGDAAAGRQAMRALEAANREGVEERAALQEAVEALKAELAEATEKGEAAAKDAARAAQVLSDLGEQVNKLRGEVGEARAREQAARTEAEGLAQERGDLMARAEEAEERVAEMGEEMMAYLDEITMLKTKITGEAQAHADALRKLQAGHDEALGSAQQEAVALSRELQGLQTEVVSLQARLQQQGEAHEQQAMVTLEESRQMVAAAEKRLEEAAWAHQQEVAALQQTLAEAEARGAEAARFKAALGTSQAEGEQLRTQLKLATGALESAELKLGAADERCAALAGQVAEAQAQLKDQEAWALERARMEAEVGRAREMEKEAYDRYEAVEQLRAQAAKEAEALGKELEEVKAANVKLVGHANARQKIQLHRKLKEELTDMQRRCKALEEENYALKQHSTADPATASGSSGSSGKVLANLTNTNAAAGGVGRRPTRTTAAAASSAEAGAGKGAADIREKLLALRGKKAEGAAAEAREEEV